MKYTSKLKDFGIILISVGLLVLFSCIFLASLMLAGTSILFLMAGLALVKVRTEPYPFSRVLKLIFISVGVSVFLISLLIILVHIGFGTILLITGIVICIFGMMSLGKEKSRY